MCTTGSVVRHMATVCWLIGHTVCIATCLTSQLLMGNKGSFHILGTACTLTSIALYGMCVCWAPMTAYGGLS